MIATDLDNTLLYSIKHRRAGDICVEWIHEKPQGYMPEAVYAHLAELQRHHRLIPVTTRSVSQYLRIHWPEGAEPEYAVAAHGAVLLHRQQIDETWREEMQPMLLPCREELEAVVSQYSGQPEILRARMVDDAYAFIYCASEALAKKIVSEYRSSTGIRLTASAKKVYFLPPLLHKGTALHLLRRRFPSEPILACGDSIMDDEMLQSADRGYTIPHGTPLPAQIINLICPTPEDFPAALMQALENDREV